MGPPPWATLTGGGGIVAKRFTIHEITDLHMHDEGGGGFMDQICIMRIKCSMRMRHLSKKKTLYFSYSSASEASFENFSIYKKKKHPPNMYFLCDFDTFFFQYFQKNPKKSKKIFPRKIFKAFYLILDISFS